MVLVPGRTRPVQLPVLPLEQRRVVTWLASERGWNWARSNFSDATECHELIEIIDDSEASVIADHAQRSCEFMLDIMRGQYKEWNDLTWTPEVSP